MATTPPDRISYNVPSVGYSSASPKTTPTFDVQAGDLLTVLASTEDRGVTLSTPTTTGSVTWTLQQSVLVNNFCAAYAWTGVVNTTQTGITVSVARASGTGAQVFGFAVTVWRNHGGVGATAKGNASGAPSLAVTCSDNSAVTYQNGDWNALSSARTWRTVNGAPMTESLYQFISGRFTAYGSYVADVGAAGSKTLGLSAPTGQAYSNVAVEVLGTTAAGGTTYDVSGTVAVSSSTSGAVSRVAKVLAVAGTVAALSATSGDVARVPQVQPVTGAVAASSSSSGDVTRLGATQAVGGTVAAVSNTSGAVTRVPLLASVSGTVAVLSSSSGDVARPGTTPSVSGTIAAVSGSQGSVSSLLAVSGTAGGTTSTSGAVTRVPRTLTVTGTTAATTATSLGVSVVGGPQTYPAAGTVAATSSSSGALSRLRAAVTGTVAASSSSSGTVDALRAPVTWQVAGTIAAESGGNASVVLVAQASGTAAATSSTSGNVFPISPQDATPNPAARLTLDATPTLALDAPTGSLTLDPTPRLELS